MCILRPPCKLTELPSLTKVIRPPHPEPLVQLHVCPGEARAQGRLAPPVPAVEQVDPLSPHEQLISVVALPRPLLASAAVARPGDVVGLAIRLVI